MVIELPFVTKSLNDLLGMHYRTRAKYTSEIKEEVGWLCKGKGEVKQFPVDVKFTIIKKNKHVGDSDNWTGKAIMDGLVLAGILPDDNTNYVRRVSYELQYGDEDKTIIEL